MSAVMSEQRFHAGLTAGIGLPKVPLSLFRTPVSVLGTGFVNYRIIKKVVLQVDGNGLTTMDLGTVNNRKAELKFDMLWASLNMMIHLSGIYKRESLLLFGMGKYHLSQRYDNDSDDLNTLGINIGFSNWRKNRRWTSVFEIKWHLLFQPSPNPQVFTFVFGIML
jgi:hypothetical protein